MCDLGRLGLQNEAADATIPTDDWERLSEFTRFRGSRARSLAWLERPADNREVASPNLAGPTSGRGLHRGRASNRPGRASTESGGLIPPRPLGGRCRSDLIARSAG